MATTHMATTHLNVFFLFNVCTYICCLDIMSYLDHLAYISCSRATLCPFRTIIFFFPISIVIILTINCIILKLFYSPLQISHEYLQFLPLPKKDTFFHVSSHTNILTKCGRKEKVTSHLKDFLIYNR